MINFKKESSENPERGGGSGEGLKNKSVNQSKEVNCKLIKVGRNRSNLLIIFS